MTSPQSTEPKGVGPGILERLRNGPPADPQAYWVTDGTATEELLNEAADTIERLVEALEAYLAWGNSSPAEFEAQFPQFAARDGTGGVVAINAFARQALTLASGDALSNEEGGSRE